MKKIKFRLIMQSIILVLSVGGLIASIIYYNAFLIGFCSSLIGSSAISLFKLYNINKNKEKAKEYEILEKDERIKSIANEAKAIAFNLILIILLGIGVVGYAIDNDTMLLFPTFTVLAAVLIYFITTAVLNKIR